MTSTAEVQIFNLELRPLMQQDFLRWRNLLAKNAANLPIPASVVGKSVSRTSGLMACSCPAQEGLPVIRQLKFVYIRFLLTNFKSVNDIQIVLIEFAARFRSNNEEVFVIKVCSGPLLVDPR
jgi:hypothetical protein